MRQRRPTEAEPWAEKGQTPPETLRRKGRGGACASGRGPMLRSSAKAQTETQLHQPGPHKKRGN